MNLISWNSLTLFFKKYLDVCIFKKRKTLNVYTEIVIHFRSLALGCRIFFVISGHVWLVVSVSVTWEKPLLATNRRQEAEKKMINKSKADKILERGVIQKQRLILFLAGTASPWSRVRQKNWINMATRFTLITSRHAAYRQCVPSDSSWCQCIPVAAFLWPN